MGVKVRSLTTYTCDICEEKRKDMKQLPDRWRKTPKFFYEPNYFREGDDIPPTEYICDKCCQNIDDLLSKLKLGTL